MKHKKYIVLFLIISCGSEVQDFNATTTASNVLSTEDQEELKIEQDLEKSTDKDFEQENIKSIEEENSKDTISESKNLKKDKYNKILLALGGGFVVLKGARLAYQFYENAPNNLEWLQERFKDIWQNLNAKSQDDDLNSSQSGSSTQDILPSSQSAPKNNVEQIKRVLDEDPWSTDPLSFDPFEIFIQNNDTQSPPVTEDPWLESGYSE